MSKNLVIVESPAKSKTVKKFLGNNYEVVASMWHVVDLPQKEFWIDENFEPTYQIMPDKKKVIQDLKKQIKKYDKVYIATDEDREWEAIGWHIINSLKLKPEETPRIVFHEITKEALQEAIKNPRQIDTNLVNAQQWRRLLDRFVGFKISPILREKVKRGLSAWRVQSVAVKLVIEKEDEINNFVPEESWKIYANIPTWEWSFSAELEKISWKKVKYKTYDEVKNLFEKINQKNKINETTDEKTWNKILKLNISEEFKLEKIETKKSKKSPQPPFITSTLQQTASNKLGWGVKQVMTVAQQLYENWYITYMRTDSPNLSKQAVQACYKFIVNNYWKDYSESKQFKAKSSWAQEAHEAIRPTDIFKTPEKSWLTWQQLSLYKLIWVRTLASQTSSAVMLNTTYNFEYRCDNKKQTWVSKGQTIDFDGFLRIYKDFFGSYQTQEQVLPKLKENDKVKTKSIIWAQQFTKPPSRYTEATLVKKLESEWIGRPSTYAPTISTIIDRGYIAKDENNKLYPTDIARMVNSFLEKNFKNLMDYKFTANMEDKLDKIAEGKYNWKQMLKDFYKPFEKELEQASKQEMEQMYVWEKCPECWNDLVYKFSRAGKFIGCSNYPNCKYTRQSEEEKNKLDALKEKFEWRPCPAWWTIVVKVWRYGPFLASSEYPKVKWISPIPDEKQEELEEKIWWETCDKCGQWTLHVKKSSKWKRKSYFLGCSNYPECDNIKSITAQGEVKDVKSWESKTSKSKSTKTTGSGKTTTRKTKSTSTSKTSKKTTTKSKTTSKKSSNSKTNKWTKKSS